MKQLTLEQKTGLFMLLASKTIYEVGLEYGFDKHYKDAKAVKGAVYRIYSDVKNNPDKYGIQDETYGLVVDAMASRAISNKKIEISDNQKRDLEKMDFKDLVISNRNRMSVLMGKKLDMISNKELKKMSLKDFGTLFGILFDKGQIIQGQATEHIAHLSKIEDGLSSKDLLEAVLNQRENTIISKEK